MKRLALLIVITAMLLSIVFSSVSMARGPRPEILHAAFYHSIVACEGAAERITANTGKTVVLTYIEIEIHGELYLVDPITIWLD